MSHRRFVPHALLGLGFWLLGASGPLAQPAEEFSESVDVVEIQLEVLVEDRDGRTVDGLQAQDFRVEVGGETAEVLSLSHVGHATASPGQERRRGASNGSAGMAEGRPDVVSDGLRLVLFVDLVHGNPATNARYLSQVLEFLKRDMDREDRVMVASYDGGVTVNLPFTSNLKDVRQSVMDLLNYASRGLSVDGEQSQIDFIQQLDVSNEDICLFADVYATRFAEQTYSEVKRAVAALESFVDSMAGMPGRKALVHLSGGLPMVAGQGPMDYVIELCGATGSAADPVEGVIDYTSHSDWEHADGDDLRMRLARFDTSDDWRRLAARANRNNISFYPIHTAGLTDSTFRGAQTQFRGTSAATSIQRASNRQDALVLLASETGGRAILNRNEVSADLDRMEDDLRQYYLLSVRGLGGETGTIRAVDVKVDRPGVRVRHRRSVRLADRSDQVAGRVLASVLYHPGENSMGLEAEVAGESPRAGERRTDPLRTVRLKLHIPLAALTLLPQGPEQPAEGRFTVFLAAADLEGRTTPVRTSTVPVTVRAGDESKEVYTFEVEMDMREGEHVVGFGVLDEIGGETSYLRQVVEG